uniref:Scavenger receptor class B member 1 n=2 Tax=Clastoptera arizonana TaxID=38151 RepID=A0A1B6D8M6_9HEMI
MKYNLDPRLMDPYNENNICFCPENNCSPNGTQNVAPCAFGSPIFVSLPHFASSDKTLQDSISGLAPGVNRNINAFHIHKTFGVLLSGRTGIQINALVSSTKDVSALNGLKVGTYLPIAWLEMDLTSPPQDMIQLLKRLSITISSVEFFLKYITILIAFICLVKLIQVIYMSAKL